MNSSCQPEFYVEEEADDENMRVKGVCITRGIVFGNSAQLLPEITEKKHTHKWTIFLRPYENEQMSMYVKKVQFRLHSTYRNPIRNLHCPPYEVHETGWGEFEVGVKIFFVDAAEKPISFHFLLKLFESIDGPTVNKRRILLNHYHSEKELFFENYDELVFRDPTQNMYNLLRTPSPLIIGPYKHNTNFDLMKKSNVAQIAKTHAIVQKNVKNLTNEVKMALKTIKIMNAVITTDNNSNSA